MITPTKQPTNIKKILILGAECTGKSTLAKDLANTFDTSYVSEYMRLYLEKKPTGYICQYDDLLPIAMGQITLENQLSKQANQYLFCDTGIFEIMAYAFWYFKKCPDDIIKLVKNSQYDLVLLTDEQGITWQADGMRDLPHGRHKMREHFITLLSDFGLDYYSIFGNRQERIQQVNQLLRKLN
ncbi:AAA family ATPase [Moraxella oblonga]|uniref:AAA family ATPase n=1 Tax=Moraxella oblonga TaxID=200413 RepID=UPI000832A115|nr:ATP-binding protein [Moraxella oblonga]